MKVRRRSISLPIVLASISVVLNIALLVGWTLLLSRYIDLTREFGAGVSYMVLGIISFVVIMTIMVLIVVFLVREILDSRKQIRFIDSVTHELKSPLASMRLSVETLATRALNEQQKQQVQAMLIDDLDRLGLFIDDILHAGRLEMRSEPLERVRIPLREFVIEHAAPILRRYQMDPGQLDVGIDEDLVLYSDQAILLTIFNNLLDNACKYSEPPRWVRVVARRVGRSRLTLSVEDRGIGIAPKEIKRVERRFYRAPSEDVRKRHGSGLGLYVVSGYASRLGGSVTVRSPGLGQGTTVELTLPMSNKHAEDDDARANPRRAPRDR